METVILIVVVNLVAIGIFYCLINSLLKTTETIKTLIKNKQSSPSPEFVLYSKKTNKLATS